MEKNNKPKINYKLISKERQEILNKSRTQEICDDFKQKPKVKKKNKNICFDKDCDEVGNYKLTDYDGDIHAYFCEKHKGNIDIVVFRPKSTKRFSRNNNVYGLNLNNNIDSQK